MAQNNDQATDRPDDGGDDRPATTSQPSGAVREENTGGEPLPGDERLDMDRTPGDGSTPVGLTVKELLKLLIRIEPLNKLAAEIDHSALLIHCGHISADSQTVRRTPALQL
jgi:hypothetical protein